MLKPLADRVLVKVDEEEKKTKPVMDYLMERIIYYTNKRAGGKMKIECILYDNQ